MEAPWCGKYGGEYYDSPSASSWGMGLSNIASRSNCSNSRRTVMARPGSISWPLKSTSSVKPGGAAASSAAIWAMMSRQRAGFQLDRAVALVRSVLHLRYPILGRHVYAPPRKGGTSRGPAVPAAGRRGRPMLGRPDRSRPSGCPCPPSRRTGVRPGGSRQAGRRRPRTGRRWTRPQPTSPPSVSTRWMKERDQFPVERCMWGATSGRKLTWSGMLSTRVIFIAPWPPRFA